MHFNKSLNLERTDYIAYEALENDKLRIYIQENGLQENQFLICNNIDNRDQLIHYQFLYYGVPRSTIGATAKQVEVFNSRKRKSLYEQTRTEFNNGLRGSTLIKAIDDYFKRTIACPLVDLTNDYTEANGNTTVEHLVDLLMSKNLTSDSRKILFNYFDWLIKDGHILQSDIKPETTMQEEPTDRMLKSIESNKIREIKREKHLKRVQNFEAHQSNLAKYESEILASLNSIVTPRVEDIKRLARKYKIRVTLLSEHWGGSSIEGAYGAYEAFINYKQK
ncbi:MAG: hypothetical protein HAW67_08355 [Endozoicomonadaceae bacterium]|nr:hypothetical protein [Endozoicomonadaceae bacterium]